MGKMGAWICLFLGWENGIRALGLGFHHWEWDKHFDKWEWDFSSL